MAPPSTAVLKLKTWKSSLISLFLESYLIPSPPLIYQQITTVLSSSCIFSYSTEALYPLPSPNCHNHASGLFTAGPQMVSVPTLACLQRILQSGSQSGGGTELGPERTMRPGYMTSITLPHCTGSKFKPPHHGLHALYELASFHPLHFPFTVVATLASSMHL